MRLALAHAGLRDGRRIGEWEVSAEVAAAVAPETLRAAELLERAKSPALEQRARATTAEFHALGVNQRPAFLLANSTGDRVIISGLAKSAPLAAAVEALLADETGQLAYAAHHGGPPPA